MAALYHADSLSCQSLVFLVEASYSTEPIDLYHAMLKKKILPVQPLIQCEAGRAKTKLFVPLGLKMAAA